MAPLGEIIKGLLEEAGVSFKTISKSFVLTCPRCQKSQKLYIRRTDGRFICWVCAEASGFKGKAEWCLTELTGKPVSELRRGLYGAGSGPSSLYLDVQIDDWFGDDDEIPMFVPDELPEVMLDPGFRELTSPQGRPGKEYLESRGVPLAIALEYGIQYSPSQQAVIFPVISRGKMVGWQTRRTGPTSWYDEDSQTLVKVPKAMTSLGLKKERTFMFGDRITGDRAVLCEGPFDALKCHLIGGNVAALGKMVSMTQLELLKHSGIRRLYLGLDPDAFVESRKVLCELSQYIEVYDLRPPKPFGDLGEMSMGDVKSLADHAPRIGPEHMFIWIDDWMKEMYASH